MQWRRRLQGSARRPSIVASTSQRRSPSARPAYQPVGAERTWTCSPARRPTSADQRGEHERVAGVGLERGVEPEPGDAGAVGVEPRLGVEHVGQLRRGDPKIAAGEAEERERELVQASVGGVVVDVVELGGEGEQEVGDGRASAGRQAREAVHFRPKLSGFIR